MATNRLLVKSLLFVCLVGAVSSLVAPQAKDWDSFKRTFGKNYDSSEEPTRREAFERSKAMVERFNREEAAERGFTLDINEMSDWSREELDARRGCLLREPNSLVRHPAIGSNFTLDQLLSGMTGEAPKEVDWRLENRAGVVQNQRKCAACWAFAATGLLEGQLKDYEELSEQFLIDNQLGGSCKGGSVRRAILQMVNRGRSADSFGPETEARILSEEACPFGGPTCSKQSFVDLGFSVAEVNQKSFKRAELEEMLAEFGPVPVSLSPDETFTSYRDGVYSCRKAASSGADPKELAVLVIGYGTDPKQGDFWLVKNSWGVSWGEDGHARIARDERNSCNLSAVTTLLPVKKLEHARS